MGMAESRRQKRVISRPTLCTINHQILGAKEMNLAIYAMKMPQQDMVGEAEKAGLGSDDAVMDLVKAVRKEADGP